MPKSTRDELFNKAMAGFMASFDVELENREIQQYGIQTYTLTNKTINKTKYEHDYELVVPKDIAIGYRDIPSDVMLENGLNYTEPIYAVQDVPNMYQFVTAFNLYFKPHQLYFHRALISYIQITNVMTDVDICDSVIHIKVIYHKSHCPFPRPLTLIEEKENEIRFLQSKVEAKTRKLTALRAILHIERDRAKYNYKRMQTRFRAMYAAEPKLEDCPVCYDEIVPEMLIIPNCFHYICEKCVVKCDSCPMCRDEYDDYIENSESLIGN